MKTFFFKKIILAFFTICSIIFFFWSKSFFVFLFLLFVTDLISFQKSLFLLKKKISKKTYEITHISIFIIIPVVFSIVIRTFFFDIYYVPSSSMETTLFPNDYLLVNKISYGTKVPRRIQEIPLLGKLVEDKPVSVKKNLYRPLKKFIFYKREDIVVFNSVQEKKCFLVKRIIGLPGENLKIIDSQVFIDGVLIQEKDSYSYNYTNIYSKERIISLSNMEYEKIKNKKFIRDVKKTSLRSNLFPYPYANNQKWTRDNYGSIYIPKKGESITLNKSNFITYKYILEHFECVNINSFKKKLPHSYVFKENYYFMLGDNRHNSEDSRYFGFVPERYIQGKVVRKF